MVMRLVAFYNRFFQGIGNSVIIQCQFVGFVDGVSDSDVTVTSTYAPMSHSLSQCQAFKYLDST